MAKTRQSGSLGPVSTYAGRVPFEENDTAKDETPDITLETRVSNLEIAVNQILIALNEINQRLDNPAQSKSQSNPKNPTTSQPKVKLSKHDKAAQAESEKATQLASEAVQKVLSNGEHLCDADIRERTGISQKRWTKVVKLLKEKDILVNDGNKDLKARLYFLKQLPTPPQEPNDVEVKPNFIVPPTDTEPELLVPEQSALGEVCESLQIAGQSFASVAEVCAHVSHILNKSSLNEPLSAQVSELIEALFAYYPKPVEKTGGQAIQHFIVGIHQPSGGRAFCVVLADGTQNTFSMSQCISTWEKQLNTRQFVSDTNIPVLDAE